MKKLKIGSLYQQTQKKSKKVPYIRLSGEYLSKYGFNQGQVITVHLQKGKIVIETYKPETS